jgi:hypothetical protein
MLNFIITHAFNRLNVQYVHDFFMVMYRYESCINEKHSIIVDFVCFFVPVALEKKYFLLFICGVPKYVSGSQNTSNFAQLARLPV